MQKCWEEANALEGHLIHLRGLGKLPLPGEVMDKPVLKDELQRREEGCSRKRKQHMHGDLREELVGRTALMGAARMWGGGGDRDQEESGQAGRRGPVQEQPRVSAKEFGWEPLKDWKQGSGAQCYVLELLVWQSVKVRDCGVESVARGEAGMAEQGGAGAVTGARSPSGSCLPRPLCLIIFLCSLGATGIGRPRWGVSVSRGCV